uniref:Uncharacterized protein n=1 Tax=Arundo donax TaxID=35708 RepID=A0A0A9U3G6_ARUDO
MYTHTLELESNLHVNIAIRKHELSCVHSSHSINCIKCHEMRDRKCASKLNG